MILHSIASSYGFRMRVDDLPVTPEEREDLAILHKDGFLQIVSSENDIVEMIVESVSHTLTLSPVPPRDLDALLVSTESFWDIAAPLVPKRVFPYDKLLRAMSRAGIRSVSPYGNWLAGCGNLTTTLTIARALIASGRHRNILLVIADRHPPGLSRLMPSGAAIYSDIAASCIIGNRATGYMLRSIVSHTDLALLTVQDANNSIAEAQALRKALLELRIKVELEAGRSLQSLSFMIADNCNSMLLEYLCDSLSINSSDVLLPTKADCGHAYSADGLLALGQLEETSRVKCGDSIGLLNCGQCTFGLAVIDVI